jgi:hypothetical protein
MQDRLPPDRRKPLATRGRTIHLGHAVLTVRRSHPVYPDGHPRENSACRKGANARLGSGDGFAESPFDPKTTDIDPVMQN